MPDGGSVRVFSYGSNSVAQLSGRVVADGEPPLEPPVAATLRRHARVFTGVAPLWGHGGVATLVEAAAGCGGDELLVRGSLVSLSPSQAARLDAFEAFYVRTRVVVTVGERDVAAFAYRMPTPPPSTRPPSEAYLFAVSRQLRDTWPEAHCGVELLGVCSEGRPFPFTPQLCPLLPPLQTVGPSLVPRVEWTRPLRPATVLAALYEAGAAAKGRGWVNAWVLPRDAAAAEKALHAAGVRSVDDLERALQPGGVLQERGADGRATRGGGGGGQCGAVVAAAVGDARLRDPPLRDALARVLRRRAAAPAEGDWMVE